MPHGMQPPSTSWLTSQAMSQPPASQERLLGPNTSALAQLFQASQPQLAQNAPEPAQQAEASAPHSEHMQHAQQPRHVQECLPPAGRPASDMHTAGKVASAGGHSPPIDDFRAASKRLLSDMGPGQALEAASLPVPALITEPSEALKLEDGHNQRHQQIEVAQADSAMLDAAHTHLELAQTRPDLAQTHPDLAWEAEPDAGAAARSGPDQLFTSGKPHSISGKNAPKSGLPKRQMNFWQEEEKTAFLNAYKVSYRQYSSVWFAMLGHWD